MSLARGVRPPQQQAVYAPARELVPRVGRATLTGHAAGLDLDATRDAFVAASHARRRPARAD